MVKLINESNALCFDDVLIVPRKSDVTPDEVVLYTKLTNNIDIKIPIISAAMDTVTGFDMALGMALLGGIGVIHRNLSIEEQSGIVSKIRSYKYSEEQKKYASLDRNGYLLTAAAIGTSAQENERINSLIKAGCNVLVLDTSQGHSDYVLKKIREIKNLKQDVEIIAGNIATKEAAIDLINEGVNAVKVGIGPGTICTTRIISGVGMPQFSAILDIAEICGKYGIPVIADGGIRNSGDFAKAIAAGATSVMIGSLIAGTDESIGEVVTIDGKKYKKYRGMGCISAMKQGSYERYFQSPNKKHMISQGVEGYVPYDGSLEDVIYQLLGGLRVTMGHTGSRNITNLHLNAMFVKVSTASIRESHVHDLSSFDTTENYKNFK